MITTLTKENFAKTIRSSEPVLVDFWATWCAPCRMQGDVLHKIEEDYPSLRIGKVNVDENPELAEQYGIEVIPTMIVFKDGQMAENITGLRQAEELLDVFRKYGAVL